MRDGDLKECCQDSANTTIEKDYHLAGLGETVERILSCKKCNLVWREVYTFSCYINDKTDKTIS